MTHSLIGVPLFQGYLSRQVLVMPHALRDGCSLDELMKLLGEMQHMHAHQLAPAILTGRLENCLALLSKFFRSRRGYPH